MDALLILYHFGDGNAFNCFLSSSQSQQLQTICHSLAALTESSNARIVSLSQSILLTNSQNYKDEWNKILNGIQTNEMSMDCLFECGDDDSINIVDHWCHSVLAIAEINNENIKLCIALSLQLFNLLSKRIQQIIKEKLDSFIISAKSMSIFLNFCHRVLKILISQKQSLRVSNRQALLKQFLSKTFIATLAILGNPQFILQFISRKPFVIDSLYRDSICVANICYSTLLLAYRFLACQYSANQNKPHQLISPSPALTKFKSFTGHAIATPKAVNQSKNESSQIYNFHKIALEFQLIASILNFVQIAQPKDKEAACNLLFYITWKQSVFMREFLNNNGLLIVTNCIIKQRDQHSANIVIQCLQIISCTARKYKKFYNKIEETGIFQTILPKLLQSKDENLEIKEKICNLIGNLCKHSDHFLAIIQREKLLNLLCDCTENADSANIRRFACYAIGNIAYQTTKSNDSSNGGKNRIDLQICIKPLSVRLVDDDYKTQENAAGAIGNLISTSTTNGNGAHIIDTMIRHNVIGLLLRQIEANSHLSVIKNCLYSLSNMCYFRQCKQSMLRMRWRRTLKICLDKFGAKDEFVKKCAFKILRKMESNY